MVRARTSVALAEAETAIAALGGSTRWSAPRFGMGWPVNRIARTVDVAAGFDQVIVVGA